MKAYQIYTTNRKLYNTSPTASALQAYNKSMRTTDPQHIHS